MALQIGQMYPAIEKPREAQWKELISGNFPKKHHSGGESFVQTDLLKSSGQD